MRYEKKPSTAKRFIWRTGLRSGILRIRDKDQWLHRNKRTLPSVRGRRLTSYNINKQNQFEVPIAKKLGASLTHGSGSINSDGDMRLNDRFLIEHKCRNNRTVSLSYDVFSKIRRQAHQRNLIPVLIVSNLQYKNDDVVLMSVEDSLEIHGKDVFIQQDESKKMKQINVPFFAVQQGQGHYGPSTFLRFLHFKKRKSLAASHIKDFKRCIRVP